MRRSTGAVVLGAVLLAGCSDGGDARNETPAPAARQDAGRAESRPAAPASSRCPPALANCSRARGRILYVERVDPDGDGDAHFVLASPEGITAPGLSVIDVEKSRRPHPLPGRGDLMSAAGPVYRGSFGQKQIEAIELHYVHKR